jgi:hypothetical protein
VKTFCALTTVVSVSIEPGLPLADIAAGIVANFPPATEAELHYVLTPSGVHRNATFLPAEQPIDVVPVFEMDLYQEVLLRAARGWILHAAALEVHGRALVLCGSSGAGKTTLSLALMARGHRLLTEEMVWISEDGTVRGLPRSLHVPESSKERARVPDSWLRLPYPIRDRAGAIRDHLLLVPPRDALVLESRPLAAIVRMGHGPGWDVHLTQSSPSEALQRLWDRSLRRDEAGLEVATTVLKRHGSYVLSSTSESEALTLLEPLLK